MSKKDKIVEVPYHRTLEDGTCACGSDHRKPPSGKREGPGELGWEIR